MNTKIRLCKLWLAVFLLAAPCYSLLAAPPSTGIRGQAFIQQFGDPTFEVAPGIFMADFDFTTFPTQTSFTVYTVYPSRSRHPVGHFTTASNGSFQVSLPPGKYVVIPDTLSDLTTLTSSFTVTVGLRHFTNIVIYYEPLIFSFTP